MPKCTRETFVAAVEAQGGRVITGGWKTIHTPMLVRCREGHLGLPMPANVVCRGGGICRVCAGQDPVYAWWGFKDRVRELGGEVLEPEWLGRSTPHRIRCVEGHGTTTYPGNVQKGQGICRVCAERDPAAAWENFRSRVEELGGEVLETTSLGTGVPHRVRCVAGHETKVRPNSVQKGQGICRFCRGKRWDAFYVAADEINDLIKFGITSGDPRPRLRNHAADGFETLHLLHTNLPGSTAPDLERLLLNTLRDAGEAPVRGREYFPARVLPLVLDIARGFLTAG